MLAVLEIQDFFFFITACLTLYLVLSTSTKSHATDGATIYATIDAKLRRLDRTMDAIIQHLDIELPEAWIKYGMSTKVCQLAEDGTKIEAIKAHRAETGVGLKESKEAIEAYLGE